MSMDKFLDVDPSVFTRCIKCDMLFLKSENHKCDAKEIKPLVKWIYETLKEYRRPLSSESLCSIINKKRGFLAYNHFEILYMVNRNKKNFKLDNKKFCSLTDWR